MLSMRVRSVRSSTIRLVAGKSAFTSLRSPSVHPAISLPLQYTTATPSCVWMRKLSGASETTGSVDIALLYYRNARVDARPQGLLPDDASFRGQHLLPAPLHISRRRRLA